MKKLAAGVIVASLCWAAPRAQADCACVAIASEVAVAVRLEAARADTLYARGDYAAALTLYVKGYAVSKDAVFLYAQAMVQRQLGRAELAGKLFRQYLAIDGDLAYRAEAEAAMRDLRGGVVAAVATTAGAGAELGGDVVGALAGGAEAGVDAGVDAGAGAVGAVGSLTQKAPKPPKVAKGAAIVLGIVAVAAVGAVAIQGIDAGFDEDVDFDKRFGLGMGLSGAVVGGTAVYLWGLTAATGTVAGVCAGPRLAHRPVVAPVAHHGGGGVAAAFSF